MTDGYAPIAADAQGQSLQSISGGDAPGANPLIPFFGYPLNADQLINPGIKMYIAVTNTYNLQLQRITYRTKPSAFLTDRISPISIRVLHPL